MVTDGSFKGLSLGVNKSNIDMNINLPTSPESISSKTNIKNIAIGCKDNEKKTD